MKSFFVLLAFIVAVNLTEAQSTLIPTDFFIVRGEIKNSQTFTLVTIQQYPATDLHQVTTLNHLGQTMSVLNNVKGVLLKDLLKGIQLNLAKPNQVYAFYLECVATDGYKTVFTWNELMNSPDGEQIYIMTGKDGKPFTGLDDRICILQLKEPGKGHLNIKGLQQITIQSVK